MRNCQSQGSGAPWSTNYWISPGHVIRWLVNAIDRPVTPHPPPTLPLDLTPSRVQMAGTEWKGWMKIQRKLLTPHAPKHTVPDPDKFNQWTGGWTFDFVLNWTLSACRWSLIHGCCSSWCCNAVGSVTLWRLFVLHKPLWSTPRLGSCMVVGPRMWCRILNFEVLCFHINVYCLFCLLFR